MRHPLPLIPNPSPAGRREARALMAATLDIRLDGGATLLRALQQAPEVVAEELRRFAQAAVPYLEAEVKDRTPAVHGLLRASIAGSVGSVASGVLGVVGTAQPYAVPVELGTKPHFPPVQALEDWVQARLGARGADIRRIAWLVARKIARHGTQGQFMFRDAFAAAQPELTRQFDAAVARIAARIDGGAPA